MHYYHLKYVKVTLNIYFFKDIDVRMMYCVEIEVILYLLLYVLWDEKLIAIYIDFCLTYHIQSHTGDKLFPCSVCPYKTSQKGSLTKHMLNDNNA